VRRFILVIEANAITETRLRHGGCVIDRQVIGQGGGSCVVSVGGLSKKRFQTGNILLI
jgi:hypothetical protein